MLEHPAFSSLWPEMGLPKPGEGVDEFGGYTLDVRQFWWGHPADKRTWLYVVGCPPERLPPVQLPLGQADAVVKPRRNGEGAVIVSKYWREATPAPFAAWLVKVARAA